MHSEGGGGESASILSNCFVPEVKLYGPTDQLRWRWHLTISILCQVTGAGAYLTVQEEKAKFWTWPKTACGKPCLNQRICQCANFSSTTCSLSHLKKLIDRWIPSSIKYIDAGTWDPRIWHGCEGWPSAEMEKSQWKLGTGTNVKFSSPAV